MITIDTPVGPFAMSGNGTAVTYARFGDFDAPDGPVPEGAEEAVRAYFDGDLTALDRIPVAQTGGEYLAQCWTALRTLTTPITYTELARITGRPTAVRAAAQGCARNEIALIVPCHRVLRSDGGLGGYRWGLEVKEWLLKHEAAHRA